MLRRIALLLAVLVAGALAAPMTASAATDWMPLWKTAGIEFWTSHGDRALDADGQPCPDIVFAWGNVGGGDFGVNDAPCHVTFDTRLWHQRPDPRDRCELVIHELGHVFGESHTLTGVMAADLDDQPLWSRVPPCRATMRRVRRHAGNFGLQPRYERPPVVVSG